MLAVRARAVRRRECDVCAARLHSPPSRVAAAVQTRCACCAYFPRCALQAASYEVVPTVGFNEEVFEKGGIRFQVTDMSGAATYRSLWASYTATSQGIIFVIDSTDRVRMAVAREELEVLLRTCGRIPLLLFANKMDVPSAMDPADVSAHLSLHTVCTSRPWTIQASNALTGEGVVEGISWLVQQLGKSEDEPPTAAASVAGAGAGATATPSAAATPTSSSAAVSRSS